MKLSLINQIKNIPNQVKIMCKIDDTKTIQSEKEVYLEAYACSDSGDGPSFAKITVDNEFLSELQKLRKICCDNGLARLAIDMGIEWCPENIEDELRLEGSELVVTPLSFWFCDRPRHCDYHIETRGLQIDDFINRVIVAEDVCLISDRKDVANLEKEIFVGLSEEENYDEIVEWVRKNFDVDMESETLAKKVKWLLRYNEAQVSV